jgi:hypothetical protein
MPANIRIRQRRSKCRALRLLSVVAIVLALTFYSYEMLRMRERAQQTAWEKVTRYDLSLLGSAVVAVHVSKTGQC